MPESRGGGAGSGCPSPEPPRRFLPPAGRGLAHEALAVRGSGGAGARRRGKVSMSRNVMRLLLLGSPNAVSGAAATLVSVCLCCRQMLPCSTWVAACLQGGRAGDQARPGRRRRVDAQLGGRVAGVQGWQVYCACQSWLRLISGVGLPCEAARAVSPCLALQPAPAPALPADDSGAPVQERWQLHRPP